MGVLKWLAVTTAAASAVSALTPEQLISAPRRSEVVPNPSGDTGLFSTSQYSFDTHSSETWWSLIDLDSGETKTLTDDSNVSEMIWLGSDGSTVLYINSTNAQIPGGVELWIADTSDFENGYKAASLSANLLGIKSVVTDSGDVRYVLRGKSYPNGTVYNDQIVTALPSSARIYDSIFVRHWDTYLTPISHAVFSGTLQSSTNDDGKVQYSSTGALENLVNPVKGAESPFPPFGGNSDYDLSPDGNWVAFKSKAPELPLANNTASYIYLVPHDGSAKAFAINGPDSPATPEGIEGDSSNPVFSPNSDKLAYFQMADREYESDRRTLYVYTIGSDETIPSLAKDWDRSPDTVKWVDQDNLVVTSEDLARSRLFSLPVDAGDDFKPTNFTNGGVVSAYYVLPDSTLLVTASAIWSSWNVYTASPDESIIKTLASANEIDPELSGLGPADIDEFYYDGNWTTLHSWIIYPEGFDKSKTYPMVLYIHGGPQGAWTDSWSTRWNPKVFADQGYVVIAPNPTGSTGFGDELTDAIQADWGGAPYDDLVKAWQYVHDNFDFVDTDNSVAAGASYGAFMITWIQGSEFGRKFKALVSHDGPFVGDAMIETDELWFIEHDFNGTFWETRDAYHNTDPSGPERVLQFSTPQLVIHSDNDFRIPVSAGIGLFNVLQERGVPSRFLNFPDEDHWVTKQENSLVWHQQVLGWLNRYSGVEEANPDAVSLDDTINPVVNINA
ncbi:dipeptidyl peptidase V [Aspergillus sclerotioniger CBS 115572]|uniref:Dipeptidyl-peptidase V n=1 Tax=Aspergillus sclerotioniger CBS 115572 TaxID=1450535 RepID=A0A317X8F9_9EURO|nr:dipeptidyl peptidase V [Aspergillus sclerotioniger CBS 115572]PWY93188.1 dipeptidyl peptidase V [Aspergillus sclerotioniger CBS 115572]